MSRVHRRRDNAVSAIILLLFCGIAWGGGALAREYSEPFPAPRFTQQDPAMWINSPPLQWSSLRGKVVLIDFWTFGCWNCYRSFPWLKALEQRYPGGDFRVIGIHTPEFEHEKEFARVLAKTREFGLEHPVMLDNDYAYWNAVGNRYWPTFYLVDKKGRVRAYFIGETHEGDPQAEAIEEQLVRLLAE